MKFKKWYFIPLILIAILAGYFIFFKKSTVAVKEIPLKDIEVKKTVSASGTVKSVHEADLSFASLGRLQNLAVKEGDQVKKGQYLAALDNYSESETAQSLKDARDSAILDKKLYIENYQTNMDAVGGEDEYKININKLDEAISKAEAAYQAQLGNVGRTYIYAPFEGTVIDLPIEVGETVSAGTMVVKLADLNNLIFEIGLDQEDFGYLSQGQEAEITLDSYDNQTFKGTVVSLPNYVNQAEGVNDFTIKIAFDKDNPMQPLEGMTGDAYIILSKTEGKVKALTFDEVEYDINDNPYVFVDDNGKARKKPIEIGLQGDIYTEVKTEIDKPIIQPNESKNKLEDGDLVKLQN
jgi:RND family efflux transporter MFP subunit